MTYDFVIVGAGLFGSVVSRELTDKGYRCLIIDKRNHVGGNCYTENVDGIVVHKYGGHILHTDNFKVWNYLNQFCSFNKYINRVKVSYKNKIYSFPINLFTLYQIWGVTNPTDAKKVLEEKRIKINNPTNLEDWMLSQVGEEIYKIFIYGYTKKQWNKEPRDLPLSIGKRVPIRLNFDDTYLTGQYQGIPIGGYNNLFNKLIEGSDILLNTSWERGRFKSKNIIYTGRIDEFFDYNFGKLEYRSLRFEEKRLDVEDFQGNAVMNYTDENVPFTRILEHKHFEFGKQNYTIVTKEYPSDIGEPFYPINNEKNNKIYSLYSDASKHLENVFFGGRLGTYRYMDMDEVVESALLLSQQFKGVKYG